MQLSYYCPKCGYTVTKNSPQGLGMAKSNHARKHLNDFKGYREYKQGNADVFSHDDARTHRPIEDFRAKVETERFSEAWIDPAGNWFNVDFSCHTKFAYHALNELDFIAAAALKHEADAVEVLFERGWIQVQASHAADIGVKLHGFIRMNEKQFGCLLSYFGDVPVLYPPQAYGKGKGWTIRELYLCKTEARKLWREE